MRLAHTTTSLLFCALFALSAPVYATDAGMELGALDMGLGAPGDVSFEASVTQKNTETETIHAGETVSVTFEISHPSTAKVTFPETFTPERWVLIDAVPQPSSGGETTGTSTWVATFGIYRPGATTLQPFDIEVKDTKGNSATLRTQPVDAKVLSIFADVAEEPSFKGPRPPVEVWVEDYTLAYVGGGAVLLAFLGLIAFLLRRRQLMAPAPPPPPRAAHEVALEKLSALAGDDLVERGEYMIFWVRMSEAVREYLGRSYGFPGTEFTTTEILVLLKQVKWPKGIGIDDIKSFLRRCDEVKFGGATPNVEESTSLLRRAFSIVELTKPRAPVVSEEESTGKVSGDDAKSDKKDRDRSKWDRPDDEQKRRSSKDRDRKRRSSDKDRKRRPRSDEDRERKRRPRSDDDRERKRKRRPRSDDDGRKRTRPKPPEEDS